MLHEQGLRDVTELEKQEFERDGVVMLKGIYPLEWVEKLETQLDDVFRFSAERTKSLGESLISGASQEGSAADMVQAVKAAGPDSPQLAIEGTADEVTSVSYVETDASNWHSGMRAHNLQSPLAKIIHQLLDTERVVFYCDQLFGAPGNASLALFAFNRVLNVLIKPVLNVASKPPSLSILTKSSLYKLKGDDLPTLITFPLCKTISVDPVTCLCA